VARRVRGELLVRLVFFFCCLALEIEELVISGELDGGINGRHRAGAQEDGRPLPDPLEEI